MYLQNAIAYGNKDLYLRARDTMKSVNVSDEVRILVERLRREIEKNKARFKEG